MAGKLDSRQKMINMMYLVFIAMLALNIGKEVLKTLGVLNSDLEYSTEQLEANSDEKYSQFKANEDKISYKSASSLVSEMKAEADSYYNFIQQIKDTILFGEEAVIDDNGKRNAYLEEVEIDGVVEKRWKYQEMDKSQSLDELFFNKDGLSTKGQEFEAKFISFPRKINEILDLIIFKEEERKMAVTQLDGSKDEDGEVINYNFDNIKENLSGRFKYEAQVLKEDGSSQDYLNYNYEGFPIVASLAKLTKIQSDVRFIENKALNDILLAITGGASSFTLFESILVPGESGKAVFYTSDTVDAQLKLGKSDDSFEFDKVELFINESLLKDNEFSIERGAIVLRKRLSSAGTYNLTGTLTQIDPVTQEAKTVNVDQKIVISTEPNSAVVSADAMRVFYKGLRNPTSISIAGVSDNTIQPSSPNALFRRSNSGGWVCSPNESAEIGSRMKVQVSGILNGVRRTFSGGEFIIKKQPDGVGSIKVNDQQFGMGQTISRTNLNYGSVTGLKPADFDYDYEYIVTAFDFKIGNNTTISISGDSVEDSQAALSAVRNARNGDNIIISNINASTRDGNLVTTGAEVGLFILTLR